MESLSWTPTASRRVLLFEYDAFGRRIQKQVFVASGGGLSLASIVRYAYDGWNLLAELDNNGSILRSYLWGLDLSGSVRGAGGVGGLVGVKTANGVMHFYAYDGNGNVMGLVDGSTGNASAEYAYGPFGEPLRITGAMGTANPFRWSTKVTDDESGLVYYGYRYYNQAPAGGSVGIPSKKQAG